MILAEQTGASLPVSPRRADETLRHISLHLLFSFLVQSVKLVFGSHGLTAEEALLHQQDGKLEEEEVEDDEEPPRKDKSQSSL